MKYKINLLPPKKINLKDQLIYFLLNYFRYIIVITQFIVIIVFFYRFQLDQELVELKDQANQKKEIIRTTQPLIDEFTQIKKKDQQIKLILDDQKKFLTMWNYLFSFFPETIYLSKLDIEKSQVRIEGKSFNPRHLYYFVNQLIKDAKFKKVNLESLKKEENAYNFILTLENF